jgi:hypothetical protein
VVLKPCTTLFGFRKKLENGGSSACISESSTVTFRS